MSDLRQRRGKKSSGTSAAAAGASASPQSKNKDVVGTSTDGQPTPIDQLRNAQARLVVSRDRTADLHSAWKNQLFRLSLIIVVVTLHQLQKSISSCILEIKDSSSSGDNDSASVSGVQAIKLIIGDSFCELMGVFIAFLLAYFLALSKSLPTYELDHWSYVLSSTFVPITLGFYFNSKQLGCVGGDTIDGSDENASTDPRHQFPAVVIYHTIVTLAYWFMKSGMQQCEEHVKMVTGSITDFERMDEKMELKKKLKAKKAGLAAKKK